MDLTNLLPDLTPLLIEALALILTSAIAAAALMVRKHFGVQVGQALQRDLHTALMSGIRAALEDGREAAADVLINEAIQHARESVPDAIKALKPTEAVLQRLARGKIAEAVRRARE
ncbi:hypothetical protein [Leisingera sp. ANG-M6]|uniref:hypothetical protein n=1 Tax=Leisingera sp. ANG-M6 TaxID=1577900 RepID=UPI00057DCB7C|nr:hypothetical protein [Leisingera sp. ANG-M6]KIC30048.1 hypothetical protein RA24_03640 [Leisingera sp. ANG-M6]